MEQINRLSVLYRIDETNMVTGQGQDRTGQLEQLLYCVNTVLHQMRTIWNTARRTVRYTVQSRAISVL